MKFINHLQHISWSDLESWVGSRVLQRGENYFKNDLVKDLVTCAEGILATVSGTDAYITLVTFTENAGEPKLSSRCTCPYRSRCKHAIATLFAYLDSIKQGNDAPEIKLSDFRLRRLKEGPRQDDLEDEFEGSPFSTDPLSELTVFLKAESKESLIEIITQFATQHPELRLDLLDRSRIEAGKTREIASSIRKEITSITSFSTGQSHGSDEGSQANFSRVKKNLTNLMNFGAHDLVIELTLFLLKRAIPYIETDDDDGDSVSQISSCLKIGFLAIKKSNWSNYEKLLFLLNAQFEDDYQLCRKASEVIDRINDVASWSKVADYFHEKLKHFPLNEANENGRSLFYKRDQLAHLVADALKRAHRSDEILTLYESEAKATHRWDIHFGMKTGSTSGPTF